MLAGPDWQNRVIDPPQLRYSVDIGDVVSRCRGLLLFELARACAKRTFVRKIKVSRICAPYQLKLLSDRNLLASSAYGEHLGFVAPQGHRLLVV